MGLPNAIYCQGIKFDTVESVLTKLFPLLGYHVTETDIQKHAVIDISKHPHLINISNVDMSYMLKLMKIDHKVIGNFILINHEDNKNILHLNITKEEAGLLCKTLYEDSAAVVDALYADLRLRSTTDLQQMQNSARDSLNLAKELHISIDLIVRIANAMKDTNNEQ